MARFENTDELKRLIDENDGLFVVSAEELRDMVRAGRLGVHVRKEISDTLQGEGIGHFPTELPALQHEQVRVYGLGSSMADIVSAVLRPSDDGDDRLRQMASVEQEDVLQKIRALVCA